MLSCGVEVQNHAISPTKICLPSPPIKPAGSAENSSSSKVQFSPILFWQMKNLALVKTSKTNPGMNNFVYTKNVGFAKNFSKMDLLKINAQLVRMFHERDSYSTLEIEIEKMILAL